MDPRPDPDPQSVRQAARAVLGGEPVATVTDRHHLAPTALAVAVEVFCDAGDAALLRLGDRRDWHQVSIVGAGGHGLNAAGFTRLATGLEQATADGAITGYHFVRKDGGLRLRVAPDNDRAHRAVAHILDSLTAHGEITRWVHGIYEPETYAFGGPAAMDVAHRLFYADSRAALAAAGRPDATAPGPRETVTLLASALLRAAGLDWYEQGAVWAIVAAHRPPLHPPSPQQRAAARAAMRTLITTDPTMAVRADPGWVPRLVAFGTAGRALAALARQGRLDRGLRAVLAHHLIFTFNRAGLSACQQSALAYLGKGAVMHTPNASTPEPRPHATSVAPVNTTTAPTDVDDEAVCLRAELVDTLRANGSITTESVAAAFTAVPRHLFVPDAALADAYADAQVFTKHATTGQAISAASQPAIVAMMLEQLRTQAGHNVLEAGAGTGYNAALIGHLVSPGGHVTTLDVDDDLVEGARAHLAAAGADNVTVLLRDGTVGDPDHAPYQRIIATVGVGDIPTAWFDQLAPDGLLLVPLRIRGGVSRSIAFVRDGTHWRAQSSKMCTFMPLRGTAEDTRHVIDLADDGQVALHTYRDQHTDPTALAGVLDRPAHEIYSEVLFRKGDPWEWTNLYLTCALPGGLVRMPMVGPAVESGTLRPQFPWGAMATVDNDSLAYLTLRESHDDTGPYWEAGAIGHGPRGSDLATELADHLRTWDRNYRISNPTIRLARGDDRDTLTGQFIIDTASTRLAIDWA